MKENKVLDNPCCVGVVGFLICMVTIIYLVAITV